MQSFAKDSEIRRLKARVAQLEAAEHERTLEAPAGYAALEFPVTVHEPGSSGHPMTVWSDWHWGENVDARQVAGINSFSEEIAHERVANLVDRSISLLRNHGGRVDGDGIHVCLGGDMVSGLIHEELVETNWGNIADQCFGVASAIEGALKAMADEFGSVVCPCVVGNHGRTSQKPKAKSRAIDSYDRSVYLFLQQRFKDDPRVTFIIPGQTDVAFTVYGHRFLLTHGDTLGTRGGDGMIGALGPITRGIIKTQVGEMIAGNTVDTVIMGHWHTYIPRGDAVPVIVNGTLKGYDEYSRQQRFRPARPSQALWLASPKHGIAAQWPVYLD